MSIESRDLLITAVETNSHHGVGILLQRMFPKSEEFVCLRTTSLYQGEEPFGGNHHELCSRFLTLDDTEKHLREILSLYRIRRIVCVPYYREEFIHALLAKQLTGAPLCTFIMDDQNVFTPQVPDHWVGGLLAASDLRLGISPEMCAAYERKYGLTLQLLPPVLDRAEPLVPCYWQREPGEPLRAAMIGNVWTAPRFEELRVLLRATGLHLDWYGNGPKASWLRGTPEEWEQDNLRCLGHLPEEDLIAALASYPFVLVPSGNLDATDDNPAFSRLSLPSRLLFLHARTTTPVMVLGHSKTAASRFVTRLGTGVCASSDPAEFDRALTSLLEPGFHRAAQRNIRRAASSLVFPAGEWIWQTLAAGRPGPVPFTSLFPSNYLEPDSGLADLPRAQPRPDRPLPARGEPFRDSYAPSFGIIRNAHLPVLAAAGVALPPREELELTHLNALLIAYMVAGALPSGGDLLFLGNDVPAEIQQLAPRFKVWRLVDPAAWQRAGFAGDPAHVIAAGTGEPYGPRFPQFAAIVSTAWCGQMGPEAPHHEGLSLYLDACTQPNGINLHFFFAILNPAYFWTGPAHAYLRRRFIAGSWPGLDDLLEVGNECFTMSEATYDRHWRAGVGKSYKELGRLLSLSLFWRKPGGPERP